MKISRVMLAGTTSGVGKTSITCAIIYGLKKRGYTTQAFKVGPDYIDPSYLSAISGNTVTHNLDVWLMGKKELVNNFITNSNSDISIIEGVMGYYDGFSGKNNHSSSHHVAALTKTNVILVLDASKTARSIAATALGFIKFHKNSRISGIILNKIASKKHKDLCVNALQNLKIPIVGIIPKNLKLSLESRHLGLIPMYEDVKLQSKILKIAKDISEFLDFDQILKIAKKADSLELTNSNAALKKSGTIVPQCTIAIALDNSFNFYYPANIEALRRCGAKIKFFSPIHDKKLFACDGIYIGGGFPEILSTPLSKNSSIKNQIKKLAEDDIPLYAECGGLMYLTKSIRYDNEKQRKSQMVGLIDAETQMHEKMKLNYTRGQIQSRCVISSSSKSNKSTVFQGHEFHYSELRHISQDTRFAYDLSIGYGITKQKDGIVQNNTLASYGHLFFDSKNFAKEFVNNCAMYSRQ